MSNTVDWNTKEIGKYLKLLSGFPFPSKNFSDEEGFPLIRIRDVVGSKIETYYQGQFISTYIIKEGDILIGMDGDFNIAKWRNQDALLNQRVLKVDVTESQELDIGFIYYWLQPYVKKINEITAATTVKHLSTKDLTKAKGKVPCINSQRRIGVILGKLDQAIEKTEALIEKYQYVKIGVMHDLFTRGVAADGKLRPTREQAPELYHKTKIGWIPKDWNLSDLKSMSKEGTQYLRTGPFGSALKGEHWVEEGHPVITIGSLGKGDFIEEELLFIGDDDARRLADFKLQLGDVVFSRVADVGRSVVIKEDQVGWIMSSNLMKISLDPQKMIPDFLQYQLSSNDLIKKQIRCKVNSGGRDVANSEVLNSLLFVQPEFDEQLAIFDLAEKIIVRLKKEQSFVRKLYLQKIGLMNALLTGKKTVTVCTPEAVHV